MPGVFQADTFQNNAFQTGVSYYIVSLTGKALNLITDRAIIQEGHKKIKK